MKKTCIGEPMSGVKKGDRCGYRQVPERACYDLDDMEKKFLKLRALMEEIAKICEKGGLRIYNVRCL